MATNIDILIIQVDRFIAVFWSLQYPSFATNGRAILISFVTKIITVALSSCVLFLDTDYNKCSYLFSLYFTRTTNIILISCIQLSVTVVVFMVSSYLGFMMVKIKKSVNPTVNLPVLQPVVPLPLTEMANSKENVKYDKKHVKRIDDEADMFYAVEIIDTSAKDEETEMSNPTEQVQGNTGPSESKSNNIFLIIKAALNTNYVVIFYSVSSIPPFQSCPLYIATVIWKMEIVMFIKYLSN